MQLNEYLQSEIKHKLSSVQKITCITAITDKKIKSAFCLSEVLGSPPHVLFNLSSFFSLALLSLRIHNRRDKKLTNNYTSIKWFFKDVIYLFCCQGHLKQFLENYQLCQKSGNNTYSAGWGGHVI